jgi:enoyl-CoA hydratase/carnithine racemase
MDFSSDVITLSIDGHVATLWLDRPEARNALGSAFWRDLPLAASALAGDPSVRVVVVAAKGPHFTVGLDLKEFGGGLLGGGGGASKATANARAYQGGAHHAGLGHFDRATRGPGHRGGARILHRGGRRSDYRLRRATRLE